MPIYEFQCNKCKIVFERFMDVSGYKVGECSQCKSKDVRGLISSVQTRFGKDFYEEEYKKGSFDTN